MYEADIGLKMDYHCIFNPQHRKPIWNPSPQYWKGRSNAPGKWIYHIRARSFLMKHSPCLQEAPDAKLVDVRSRAEWDWVGRIPGAIEIEWQSYPGMRHNPDFLNYLSSQVDKESLVMFICRSGGRSHQAAATATEMGYTSCYQRSRRI